jgi:hypothetical protein
MCDDYAQVSIYVMALMIGLAIQQHRVRIEAHALKVQRAARHESR